MKKTLLALAILISGALYAAEIDVDEKIEKSFLKTFPRAEKVTWYENDTHYEVLFMNESVQCRMWLDKDGVALRSERYYKEESLCPFILAKVKDKYADKKVFGVTEVNTAGGIEYHIILEDEKKWYHINADGSGNLSVQKKFTKA